MSFISPFIPSFVRELKSSELALLSACDIVCKGPKSYIIAQLKLFFLEDGFPDCFNLLVFSFLTL